MKMSYSTTLQCMVFLKFTLIGVSLWGCAAMKQKLNRKESQALSLSREEALRNHSSLTEQQERELTRYFGESAILMLNDGFRFHPDSGLVGASAILRYRSEAMATERQKDSASTESRSEQQWKENTEFTTLEVERRKSKPLSILWLLLLVPVFWFMSRRF